MQVFIVNLVSDATRASPGAGRVVYERVHRLVQRLLCRGFQVVFVQRQRIPGPILFRIDLRGRKPLVLICTGRTSSDAASARICTESLSYLSLAGLASPSCMERALLPIVQSVQRLENSGKHASLT